MKFFPKIVFVSVLLFFLIFPQQLSKSCGESYSYVTGYSIINPLIVEIPNQKPLTFTYTYLNKYWSEGSDVQIEDKNLLEWQNQRANDCLKAFNENNFNFPKRNNYDKWLAQNYRQTDFFKWVLKECPRFEKF